MTAVAGETLEQKFVEFHAANPHVYERLVALARQARARGRDKLGMKMLFEVVRWEHTLRTDDPEFKLNNNYTAFYARLIMAREPDLRGIFDTREQRHERPSRGWVHVDAGDGRLFS